MRSVKGLLAIIGVAAVAVAIATPASANCIPNKTASTFGATYVYWHLPAGGGQTAATGLKGSFWTLGNRAGGNEGSCTVDALAGTPGGCGGAAAGWLYFSGAGLNVNAVLGSAPVAACPSGTIVIVAQTTVDSGAGSAIHVATATESSATFDLTANGDQNLVTIPRPRVTSSSRVGTTVNLNVAVDSLNGIASGPAAASAVTGIRLVAAKGTSDPGRAGSYPTVLGSATGTGPASFSNVALDCSVTGTDYFVGVQVLMDQAQVSYTSATTRVKCDPTLADPKYKIVPKKGGPKANLNPNN